MDVKPQMKIYCSTFVTCVTFSIAVCCFIEGGRQLKDEISIAKNMALVEKQRKVAGVEKKLSPFANEGRKKNEPSRGRNLRNSGNRAIKMNSYSWYICFVIASLFCAASTTFCVWTIKRDKGYLRYMCRRLISTYKAEGGRRRAQAQPYIDMIYAFPQGNEAPELHRVV